MADKRPADQAAQISICGVLDTATISSLVELAIHAGAALVVQPRQLAATVLPAVPARPLALPGKVSRQARPRRTIVRRPRRVPDASPPTEAARPEPERAAPNRGAAGELRWAILRATVAAGEAGMSFGGLLKSKDLKAPIGYVGQDEEKRVAALRNALTTLRVAGLVERAVGQWCATEAGRERHRQGREGGAI